MDIAEPHSEEPSARRHLVCPSDKLLSQPLRLTSYPQPKLYRVRFWKRSMQILFLWTLFLYPFITASHIFYLIPQALLLLIGTYRLLSDVHVKDFTWRKFDLVFLALSAVAFAISGELSAAVPEYSEVGKLTLNIATVLLLLFLPGIIDLVQLGRWLPRFVLIWLSIVVVIYIRSGTTFLDFALLFSSDASVTSTSLYGFAEPLSYLFLTKNIAAMYIVATYGLFLYSSRSASQKTKLWQHGAFLALVLAFASRQAILSILVMLGVARMCSNASSKRRWTEFALAGCAGIAVFLAIFNLHSSEDGAFTRIGLWTYFMQHALGFLIVGQGLHGLNESLAPLEIDNYHMFFMNQIGAYGIIHCLVFNLFLVILMLRVQPKRYVWLLIAPYWLNVCFQTYGYEYGNLFLLVVAADRFDFVSLEDHLFAKKPQRSLLSTA